MKSTETINLNLSKTSHFTLLLSNTRIYKKELDPRIGFLHKPNYRSLSLHLDIAEIFTLLNKNEITAKSFKTDSGRIRFTNEGIKKITE